MVSVTNDAPGARNAGVSEPGSNCGSFFSPTRCSIASRARFNRTCFSLSVNELSMRPPILITQLGRAGGLFQPPILAVVIDQRLALSSAARRDDFCNEQGIDARIEGLQHATIQPGQPAYDQRRAGDQ